MFNDSSLEQIRNEIIELTKKYAMIKEKKEFIPGKTWILYSGRVFGNEEYEAMVEASLDGWVTEGKYTEQFEKELSNYLKVKYTALVNSGSSANLIAISSLTSDYLDINKLKPGDEVITVAAGFPTTINPIIQNSLIPVFVDVDLGTYNVNIEELKSAVNDKTKAIILAHTLGNPFDVYAVKKIAEEYDLFLIEDNCDALGSEYDGRKTGTFGDFSTLSFYPAHHITTGEGGAISTSNKDLDRIARSFRDWGRDCYCKPGASNTCGMRFSQQFGELPFGYDHKYVYSHIGYNLKATDIQAALGLAQIKKIDYFVEKRKENFSTLYKALKDYSNLIIMPKKTKNSNPSWFGFPITIRDDAGFKRADIVNYLEQNKIATRMLFAGNATKQPAYLKIKKRIVGDLKNTDKIMNDSFFVGVYPGIGIEQLNYMIDILEKFFKKYN